MTKAWEQVEFDGWIRSHKWNKDLYEQYIEEGEMDNSGVWEAAIHAPEIGRLLSARGHSREQAIQNLLDKVPAFKEQCKKDRDRIIEFHDTKMRMIKYFEEFRHRQNLGTNAIHS